MIVFFVFFYQNDRIFFTKKTKLIVRITGSKKTVLAPLAPKNRFGTPGASGTHGANGASGAKTVFWSQ